MNTPTFRSTVAAVGAGFLIAAGTAVAVAQSGPAAPPAGSSAGVTTADAALTKSLSFSREEERMARDLYAVIAERYDGARPFSMITRSEQQHFDAIGTLLTRYGIADPSAGRAAGSYADATLQQLYDGWLATAKTSLRNAYQVGVELETRDVADLKEQIAAVSQADVDRVYENLLAASEHHLAAFTAAATGTTGTTGTGPGAGPGAGNGPGMGNRNGNGPGMGGGATSRGHSGNGPGMSNRGGNGMRGGLGPNQGAGNGRGTCPYAETSGSGS